MKNQQNTDGLCKGLSLTSLAVSILGFLTGWLGLGVLFDFIGIVFGVIVVVIGRKKNVRCGLATAGILIGALGAVLMLLIYVAPTINFQQNQQNDDGECRINVQGAFVLLDPADKQLYSIEGLDAVERYFFVVFDVTGSDTNEDISNGIQLTINNTNTYGSHYALSSTRLRTFLDNCGYADVGEYRTLWGGSETVRMCAVFTINENDIKDSYTAVLDFDLSDNIKASVNLTADDVQEIDLFDGIFAVEDDADTYQLVHSVKARAQKSKTALDSASWKAANGDNSLMGIALLSCEAFFSENLWGASCDGYITSELPPLSLETIRSVSPSDADAIETVNNNITIVREELGKDTPDYDAVKTAYQAAYDALTKMVDE